MFCPSSCKIINTASMTLIYKKALIEIDTDKLLYSQQIMFCIGANLKNTHAILLKLQ